MKCSGWAPEEARLLLYSSRLDWQASLSSQLKLFLNTSLHHEPGALILGWTILGALIEGTMKLFLSVWLCDYQKEKVKKEINVIFNRDNLIQPDELALERLKVFFSKRIFTKEHREMLKEGPEIDWIEWIEYIQKKRNTIHSFKSRGIADFHDYFKNVKLFLQFLRTMNCDCIAKVINQAKFELLIKCLSK